MKVTVKELRALIAEAEMWDKKTQSWLPLGPGQGGEMWDEKTQSWVPLPPKGLSWEQEQKAVRDSTLKKDEDEMAARDNQRAERAQEYHRQSQGGQKTQQESKVLLDQEPDQPRDALDDIRTVNQLVMGIRSKLSKVTDPRALRTIAAVVDAVIKDLPSLKQKDQKTGGFAAGVRRALDLRRMGQ